MKRVLCLYRVSTKQQVNSEDDIPVQRRECMSFIEMHPDWVFIAEKLEKGVSGYKLSVEQRDVLVEIKKMAEQKQFDILLVFMFDRLGRREDETPFLVEWFIAHDIEVWSTREGQTRLDNRSDKLINYIRYWQAGGESEKTSMRVKAAQTQMTTDGIWRGGGIPFGYRLVHNGRVNKKGHPLYDLEIDPEQAKQVQRIFQLYCIEGYGTTNIANIMNREYPSEKKIWVETTLRRVLMNPIYIGRLHMNDTVSEPIEVLRVITDEEYNFAQNIRGKHIQRKYKAEREIENIHMPYGTETKAAVYGATLLSGLLYCAHCGRKLVGGYCTKQNGTKAYHRPIYRCYAKSVKSRNCDGQTVYSAKIIEPAVVKAVKKYFQIILRTVDPSWIEKAKERIFLQEKKHLESLVKEHDQLEIDAESLRDEVMRSLRKEDTFPIDVLTELINRNNASAEKNASEIAAVRSRLEKESNQLRQLEEQYRCIGDWANIFDVAPNDMKKMIMARFIERITVDRHYSISIYFYVSSDTFEKQMNGNNSGIIVFQADRPMDWLIPNNSK